MSAIHESGSAGLAAFAAELRPEQVPEPVWRRAEELLLDWFGSALAARARGRWPASPTSPPRWGRPTARRNC